MNQFIIILNGPMGSGKTTTTGIIMSKSKKLFRVSPRDIQFFISDYNPERDRELIHECMTMLANKILEAGMSLVLEGGSITQAKINDSFKILGEKKGVKIFSVNLEAPLEILKTRWEERKKLRAARGEKSLITTEEEFMKRYDAYLSVRGNNPVFDSSKLTPEEIAEEILNLVK